MARPRSRLFGDVFDTPKVGKVRSVESARGVAGPRYAGRGEWPAVKMLCHHEGVGSAKFSVLARELGRLHARRGEGQGQGPRARACVTWGGRAPAAVDAAVATEACFDKSTGGEWLLLDEGILR